MWTKPFGTSFWTLNTYPSDSHRLLTHILRSAGTKNSYLWATIPAIIPLLMSYLHPKVKHIIDHCCWLNFSCLVIVSWPPSMRITHFQRNEAFNPHFDGIYASGGNGKLRLTWKCHENSPWKSIISSTSPMYVIPCLCYSKIGEIQWYPHDTPMTCVVLSLHPQKATPNEKCPILHAYISMFDGYISLFLMVKPPVFDG